MGEQRLCRHRFLFAEPGQLLGVEGRVVLHILLKLLERLAFLLCVVRRSLGFLHLPRDPRGLTLFIAPFAHRFGEKGNGQAKSQQEGDRKVRRTAAAE